MRSIVTLAALLLFFAAPASAQVRALAPADVNTRAPAFSGDRVLWGSVDGRVLRVLAEPADGGPATPFAEVALVRPGPWRLAAAPGLAAVQLLESGSVFAGVADGPFAPLASNLGEGASS